jgi:predicted restriction endonuclease
MAGFTYKIKKQLREAGRFECCEFCGFKCPRLKNNGLHAAHIISDSLDGPEHVDNAIVLCPSCTEVFDRFTKAKIYKAFELAKQDGLKYSVPEDWPNAEGRRGDDDI